MDLESVLSFLHGWAFLLATFGIALGYAMFKGRQALMNVIIGSYLALLLFHLFPAKDKIAEMAGSDKSEAIALLILFLVFTFLAAWLFARMMPSEFLEGSFETIGKKVLLALAAMILIMTLCTHYLPVNEIISTGTPLPEMLLTEKLAYLWLMVPLVILFII